MGILGDDLVRRWLVGGLETVVEITRLAPPQSKVRFGPGGVEKDAFTGRYQIRAGI